MSLAATVVLSIAVMGAAWCASAGSDLVRFPATFAEGVHYATVNRGNIKQDLYTSQAALDAVKAGQPFPSGTVVTLVDTRDGELFRYVVMEKRAGWGADYRPDRRNGEWEFQAFNADKTVNSSENLGRCFACHQSQARNDFVFTRDRMKAAK
jgi:hypothetical protein